MKKINDFKNNALKVEHVPNVFENLNSFETMLKMLKNDANVLKMYFWIFNVFRYFWIFLKIYQNMGQKLGSNSSDHPSRSGFLCEKKKQGILVLYWLKRFGVSHQTF